jgi:hypothetical protein
LFGLHISNFITLSLNLILKGKNSNPMVAEQLFSIFFLVDFNPCNKKVVFPTPI